MPSGTGLIIMANSNIHAFGNTFSNNRSAHVMLTAYTEPFTDERYNPLPRDIVLSNNSYGEGGNDPQGMLLPLAMLMGGSLPDIVTDGVTRYHDGDDQDLNLVIDEDESVGFLSFGLGTYPLNPMNASPSTERPAGTPVEQPAAVSLPQDQD